MPDIKLMVTNSGGTAAAEKGPAFEARVKFPLLRTRLLNAHGSESNTLGPDALGPLIWYAPSGVLLWLAWEKPLEVGESAQIELKYDGEPPINYNVETSSRSLNREVLATPGLRTLDAARVAEVRNELIEARHLEVDEETAELLKAFVDTRRAEIAATADDKRRCQMAFFLDYDLATNPRLPGKTPLLVADIESATRLLVDRAIGRAKNGSVPAGVTIDADVLRRLSDLQLDVFRRHFPDRPADIDVEHFADAFVAFSIGQLAPAKFGAWNGRPDSAFFFLFAEFAIHAIERGVCVEAWKALLPTFVMCQELYTQVYAPFCADPPPVTPVPVASRTFKMYRQDGRTPSNIDDLIRDVRTRYGALDPSDVDEFIRRHTENAHSAFPLGETGNDDPCDVVREATQNPLAGDTTMAQDEKLGTILQAMAHYVDQYLTGMKVELNDDKYVLVDTVNLPARPEKGYFVFPRRNAATAALQARTDAHVLGPLTVIYDVATGAGWYPATLVKEIHIVNKDLKMTGTENGKPKTWTYANDRYDTVIIVLPK